jgi:hypothetical protein
MYSGLLRQAFLYFSVTVEADFLLRAYQEFGEIGLMRPMTRQTIAHCYGAMHVCPFPRQFNVALATELFGSFGHQQVTRITSMSIVTYCTARLEWRVDKFQGWFGLMADVT